MLKKRFFAWLDEPYDKAVTTLNRLIIFPYKILAIASVLMLVSQQGILAFLIGGIAVFILAAYTPFFLIWVLFHLYSFSPAALLFFLAFSMLNVAILTKKYFLIWKYFDQLPTRKRNLLILLEAIFIAAPFIIMATHTPTPMGFSNR